MRRWFWKILGWHLSHWKISTEFGDEVLISVWSRGPTKALSRAIINGIWSMLNPDSDDGERMWGVLGESEEEDA